MPKKKRGMKAKHKNRAKLLWQVDEHLLAIRRDKNREEKGMRELARTARENLKNGKFTRVVSFLSLHSQHCAGRLLTTNGKTPSGIKLRLLRDQKLLDKLNDILSGSAGD